MFISNNFASFHLWWKENLVKHQNILKYENGCSLMVYLLNRLNKRVHLCGWYHISYLWRKSTKSMIPKEGFESNYMKLIQDNCHLLLSGNKHETIWVNVEKTKTWESRKQKLVRISNDENLHFDKYILNECKKACRKLSALTRIYTFVSLGLRRVLIKAFIEL